MTRRPGALAAAVLTALLLPGCGSAAAPRASSPPSTPRSTVVADAAVQLYADYLTALRGARSEHYRGTVEYSDGTSVSIDVTATQTAAHLVARTVGVTVEEIVSNGHVYQRGGGHGPDWVTLPPTEARSALALTMQREAECAVHEHGRLQLGPRTRVAGHLVATIVDDGAAPGAAPQNSYLTLDTPVHLVRVVQTGPETGGGSPDCGHEPGPVAVSASVDYDSFDVPALITPPPNPTDLNGPTI